MLPRIGLGVAAGLASTYATVGALYLNLVSLGLAWVLILRTVMEASGGLWLLGMGSCRAAVATMGVPVAVGMLGFTGAGIAAGSAAAKMMSAAAIANGGGVAAGGAVATLQSIGAAGLSFATKAAITAGGALLGAIRK